MELTVLGCSGSFGTPESPCSGYLVRHDGTTVWLDAGAGTLAKLQQHVDVTDVDGIVLSHDHPDHWTDVMGYAVVVQYFRERRGIPVYSPARVRELVEAVQGEIEPHFAWTDVVDGSRATIGSLSFTFSQTDHGDVTLAARIEGGGRVLGYSADTGPAWSLSALGPGIDLALVEASFTAEQERPGVHLSGRQAGLTAKEAGAGRLLLTHLQPWLEPDILRAEAEATFGGPVLVAAPNERYEV